MPDAASPKRLWRSFGNSLPEAFEKIPNPGAPDGDTFACYPLHQPLQPNRLRPPMRLEHEQNPGAVFVDFVRCMTPLNYFESKPVGII